MIGSIHTHQQLRKQIYDWIHTKTQQLRKQIYDWVHTHTI